MKIALITANLGKIDAPGQHVEQKLPEGFIFDIFDFNDGNFPLRTNAMSPRLQAKIPKMYGWDLKPGYDYYIWLDGAFTLSHELAVQWFFDRCLDHDMAFFLHPQRTSILQEFNTVQFHMGERRAYLLNRYLGEPMKEQVEMYLHDYGYKDDTLYSAGVFIYKNNTRSRACLEMWFNHCCRYSIQDQLSLPFVIWQTCCDIGILEGDPLWSMCLQYHDHVYDREWTEEQKSIMGKK